MSQAKKASPQQSVPSQTKETTSTSSRPSKAVPEICSGPSPEPDSKLATWLKAQATMFQRLTAKGYRLKLDFVENAREKGELLLEVQERVKHIPGKFFVWVHSGAGIGYSTALLWIDVAKHYDDVKKRFADSNPLELTLRKVRDAIRDARHEGGRGKPGSGRRKKETTETPTDNDGVEVGANQCDDLDGTEDAAPDNSLWEEAAAKAEAEAAQVDGDETNEQKPPLYNLTVFVANEGDQMNVQNALSNWSPTSTKPIGTKQNRSVSAHIRPDAIGTALQKLGKALEGQQRKSLKVSIE